MLRSFIIGLFTAILIPAYSFAQASMPTQSVADNGYVSAQLITSSDVISTTEPFKVGVQFYMKDGWHIYWENPGDAGLPTRVNVKADAQLDVSKFEAPAPIRFILQGVVNYGFKDNVLYQASATLNESTPNDALVTLKANTTFLMCKETCIPGEFNLQKTLEVKSTASPSKNSIIFDQEKPMTALVDDVYAYYTDESALTFTVKIQDNNLSEIQSAYFIPEEDGLINDSKEQPLTRPTPDTLEVKLHRDTFYAEDVPATISGTLILNESIIVDVKDIKLVQSLPEAHKKEALQNDVTTLFWAILFAFIAGLILNLMPCVLPVLSLKVMGLIHHAGENNAYRHGIVYTIGSIFTFNILASILVLSTDIGKNIGWGFQLQNPIFVAFLAIVMLLIIMQLMGIFNIGNAFSKFDNLENKVTYKSTFIAGMLMVLLATPCTAPFMGSAIAYALTQDGLTTYSIFTSLGFGLALPYLILTSTPSLLKKLPKPGSWENTLKEFFVFPIAATMIWLVWVFYNQTNESTFYILLAALFSIAFITWLRDKMAYKRCLTVILWATIVLALWVLNSNENNVEPSHTDAKYINNTVWNLWDAEAVQHELSNGKNVFINFTADWCITCKINEKTTLASSDTLEMFANNNVTLFKADWTKYNENITQALEHYGRKGVPLYVFISADKPNEVVILNQILTKSHIRETLLMLSKS